jgi:hypothetical protein
MLDKTFFKFFLGFLAIIVVSCSVILIARLYQSNESKIEQKSMEAKQP